MLLQPSSPGETAIFIDTLHPNTLAAFSSEQSAVWRTKPDRTSDFYPHRPSAAIKKPEGSVFPQSFFQPTALKGPATQKGIYFPSSESFEALSFGSCALAKSKKLCCGVCSPGGVNPRCRYAARVTQRPRGVRFKKPICIRYGS